MKLSSLVLKAILSLVVTGLTPAFAGPGEGGGGNTVGDKLFDDYVVEGSVVIPAAEIAKLAEVYLNDLDHKLPGFANRLRQGITGIVWYKESKLLSQTGTCRNGSDTGLTPPIGQVVRACQNKLNVRIEKDWYEQNLASNPSLVSGLIMHELLVFQRIRNPKIIEDGVLRISRDIRSLAMSAEQLQAELKITDFGNYETVAQALKSTFKAADDIVAIVCIAEIHSPNYRPSDYTKDLDVSAQKYAQLMKFADAKTLVAAQKQQALLDKIIKGIKGKNSFDYCANHCTGAYDCSQKGM